MRGGWTSGHDAAPEPVAVPEGTPEAPSPAPAPVPSATITPARSAQVTPVGSGPVNPAPQADPMSGKGREPLRLNVPIGEPSAARAPSEPARIDAAGDTLSLGTAAGPPSLSVPVPVPKPAESSRLDSRLGGVGASASFGGAAPLPDHGPNQVASGPSVSPARIQLDSATASGGSATDAPGARSGGRDGASFPGATTRAGLVISRTAAVGSGQAPSLHLGLLADVPAPVGTQASPAQVRTPASPSLPGSPGGGRLSADGHASSVAGMSESQSSTRRLGVGDATTASASRASSSALQTGTSKVRSDAAANVLPIQPGASTALHLAAGHDVPVDVTVPGPATTASRQGDQPLTSGAYDVGSTGSRDESARLQAEREARDEERRNHGSALSRWLRDHFPFFF